MSHARAEDTSGLIRAVASGDQTAAGRLLDRHRERLQRLVHARLDRRLVARVDPSDVVQEAMADAFRCLPDYVRDRPLPFYPWLRQIALARLADAYRRHVVARRRSVDREQDLQLSDASAAKLATRILSQEAGPLRNLLQRELQRCTQQAMAGLKEADREILLLRYLEGLDTRAAAEVLGISESAAKVRLVRSVRRLRKILDDELGNEP